MEKISASIVTYNTSKEDLEKLFHSLELFLGEFTLYIVDNSSTERIKNLISTSLKFAYYHNPSNPGFGASHNLAIEKALESGSLYHFIVNPDIYFTEDIITPMVDYMKNNQNVGMIMPQILNEDGTVQNLPKLLPSPFSVLMRKFKKPKELYNKFIEKYELRFVDKNLIYDAPILSGCFTLLNLEAIKEVGLYDDNFFMYFEDWDLSRRMHQKYRTVYFPKISVVHGYESGANKNRKLFKIFVKSAICYFNKWGWFFDGKRIKINRKTLEQF